jgi:signal transduction histidine kinase
MQLTSPIKAIRRHFKRVKTESKSAAYQKWRHRFLLERLHLAVWIATIAYPIFLVLILLLVIALRAAGAANESPNNPEEFLLLGIKCSATELSLILCLTLLKIKSVCRYPELIFLGFSWSFTLLWQIHDTLRGEPHQLNLIYWFLFPFQALLVPVHWRLHLVSQLSPLVYHFGVNPLLGLDPKIEHPIYFITYVLFIFIICFIFNLAVYLYERILWSEFELRQQLRVFLHAVSHDLRNPVLGTVMY